MYMSTLAAQAHAAESWLAELTEQDKAVIHRTATRVLDASGISVDGPPGKLLAGRYVLVEFELLADGSARNERLRATNLDRLMHARLIEQCVAAIKDVRFSKVGGETSSERALFVVGFE